MERKVVAGIAAVVSVLIGLSATAQAPGYDPLEIPALVLPEPFDLSAHDQERQRDIPLRVYLPSSTTPAPVVLFSHGLGGSREGSTYLGEHWAARGYLAVFLQHPGSDDSVWRDVPAAQRMRALRRAANLRNSLDRFKDVSAVLDQLDLWNDTDGHRLATRMDLSRIGMSGHSFGAVTTQAVSGQTAFRGNVSFTDPRIRAALVQSPSSPSWGDPGQAFGRVQIPWLLMTGTKDTSPIGNATVESRLAVYPALPAGGNYELVLDGAEHSAFTERALPGDTERRNPNHHRVILALSTAFWDAWLQGDGSARTWLDGHGPRSILEPGDRWQWK